MKAVKQNFVLSTFYEKEKFIISGFTKIFVNKTILEVLVDIKDNLINYWLIWKDEKGYNIKYVIRKFLLL